MKQTTPRSEWENIQGFDPNKREYIRLDGDAWLTAHDIQAEGERRGKRNQPGSDETLPDAMYQKIENWVRKRALDCKEEVGKGIVTLLNGRAANWHRTQAQAAAVTVCHRPIAWLRNWRNVFQDIR